MRVLYCGITCHILVQYIFRFSSDQSLPRLVLHAQSIVQDSVALSIIPHSDRNVSSLHARSRYYDLGIFYRCHRPVVLIGIYLLFFDDN